MTAYAVKGIDPGVAIAVAEAPGRNRLVLVDTVTDLPVVPDNG
jgi:hypothetical protein